MRFANFVKNAANIHCIEKQNRERSRQAQRWGRFSMFKFLKNVSREMQKVSWPKGQELVRYTITVLTTVAFVSVFFAVVDLGISWGLEFFFPE